MLNRFIQGITLTAMLAGCNVLSAKTKVCDRVTINDANKPQKVLYVPVMFGVSGVELAWDLDGDGSIDEILEFHSKDSSISMDRNVLPVEIIKNAKPWEWEHRVAKGFSEEQQYIVIKKGDVLPFQTYTLPETVRECYTRLVQLIRQENTPKKVAFFKDKENHDVVWAWDLDDDGIVDEALYLCDAETLWNSKNIRAKERLLFELSLEPFGERMHFVAEDIKPEQQYIKTHTNIKVMHPSFRRHLTMQYQSER